MSGLRLWLGGYWRSEHLVVSLIMVDPNWLLMDNLCVSLGAMVNLFSRHVHWLVVSIFLMMGRHYMSHRSMLDFSVSDVSMLDVV